MCRRKHNNEGGDGDMMEHLQKFRSGSNNWVDHSIWWDIEQFFKDALEGKVSMRF